MNNNILNQKHPHTARVFMNGQSQAVRIPKEFRFNADEVFISRNENGDIVLSEKKPTWTNFFAMFNDPNGLESFMADREQDTPQDKDLF